MKRIISFALIYYISLIIVTLCWVGAEYVFEGVVHSSDVDGAVECLLAYFVTKDIIAHRNT